MKLDKRRRAVIVAVLMLATSALATLAMPTVYLADRIGKPDLETLFPKSFGDWVVDTSVPLQLVAPDAQALLSKLYNQTLSRTYVNRQGKRIMLSVAYGGDQSDGTRAHRPDVCYPSQGFDLLASTDTHIETLGRAVTVRQLVAKMGNRVEPITYWIVVGDRVVVSGTQQKLAQMKYGLQGLIADGMLVRVSSIDSDRQAAYSLQQAFVNAMVGAIPENLRSRVIGTSQV